MLGNKIIFFVIIMCFSFGNNKMMDSHYQIGIDAYLNNQYDLAIQEFELILKNGWISEELYYNLGNAYYRNGDIAGAVWAYESCLISSPTHQNAKYNLKLANLKVKDRIELPDAPFYFNWYLIIKGLFDVSTWISITLFIFLIFSIVISLTKYFSLKINYYIQNIILTTFIVCSFFTIHSIWENHSVSQGIIDKIKVEVRSEPNSFSTRLFEVHQGLKVIVNQISKNWLEIELLDGKSGWIKKSEIRLIK